MNEAMMQIFRTRLLQRWLVMGRLAEGATFFARKFRLLEYVRVKKAAETGKSAEKVHVSKRLLRKHERALRVMQAVARAYCGRRWETRKKVALTKLSVLLKVKLANFKEWVRNRAADTVGSFIRDTKFNFAVFATVVNQFRRNVIRAQRMARNFIACRRARYVKPGEERSDEPFEHP